MSLWDVVLIGLAAVAGGAVNALAGGGTLITFPALMAAGVPAVAANVTNTVALCPGYLGGSVAQLKDLRGQQRRIWLLAPASVIGGLLGAVLLLQTSERLFRSLVPFLILLAAGLLAVQDPVRAWITKRQQPHATGGSEAWAALPVGLAAIYGGYFGAGLGVIVLAVLGLVLDDTLTRLNGLKQVVSLFANVTAAIFFVFSDQVVWPAALVMAVGALIGGALGGRLAGLLRPAMLRRIVVTLGVAIGLLYLVR
ncbi:sulfite exporter TauE/SafE family protein [Kallotenue papyrolyticum]|uniref:sulfite exporter TauE/SafE family protein n=1 Tax=Kallotenue papyrolyticum TaxID=1325125 RepID=UPI0004922349|nr:sulfite exporter TauE/SafE family protein [Kallotenue papyrolyticum]